MDHDDRPIGRLLSRREALALLGAAGLGVLVGCAPKSTEAPQPTGLASAAPPSLNPEVQTAVATATANPAGTATTPTSIAELPNCVATPEQTVGPYYADVQLNRSDVRSDTSTGVVKEGVPLQLTIRVSQISGTGCAPLPGAIVEIWHCDAQGVYSAFAQEGTANQNFLRGYQTTDANGQVQFTTIYPGWYQGRTVHIHFKVHTTGANGQAYEFTSQLYFDDAISDQVFSRPPYNAKGRRDQTNATDGIYRDGGEQLMLTLTPVGDGYAASFHVGLDLSDSGVGAADRMGGGLRP
ncbi:intradiol ring-cleavage dioxygenase [Kallotenue papyrolyticum]|uniref:intradiol ring-cleavage dioxygenase n=1 Tax=Kallotenue papyrolyticum TaxID=1325125 RepID=UPI0004926AC7|nr:intradiol ring-cleavage dioxygenase [Kallotenue papyrolyticum]